MENLMTKHNTARRLVLLALTYLDTRRNARRRFRQLVAAKKAAAVVLAGFNQTIAWLLSAGVTIAMAVLDQRRRNRKPASAPEPVGKPEPTPIASPALPNPTAEQVVQTDLPCPEVPTSPLFVASPRLDRRRQKVRLTYKPWKGQKLKEGQYLAVKDGKKYRPAGAA
jgi:hypothetical protein